MRTERPLRRIVIAPQYQGTHSYDSKRYAFTAMVGRLVKERIHLDKEPIAMFLHARSR